MRPFQIDVQVMHIRLIHMFVYVGQMWSVAVVKLSATSIYW